MDSPRRKWRTPRHESRGWLFRRGSRNVGENESQRHGHSFEKHHLPQHCAHSPRRCLVGRYDRRAARRADRLAGQPLDSRNRQADRRESRSPERALYRPRFAMSHYRPLLGISHRRSATRFHFWRTPRHYHAARLSSVQLELWRLHRRHHGLGNDRRRSRHRRQSSPRSHGHAALLRLSHWRLFPPLDPDAALAYRHPAHLPRELVPQGRRRQIHLARLQRKYARLEMDRGPRPRPCPGPRNSHRLDARLRRYGMDRPGFSPQEIRSAAGIRRQSLAPRSHRARRALHRATRPPPHRNGLRTRTPHLSFVIFSCFVVSCTGTAGRARFLLEPLPSRPHALKLRCQSNSRRFERSEESLFVPLFLTRFRLRVPPSAVPYNLKIALS